MTNINEATLPATHGVIYHLSVSADQVANNIIVVGDPERVPKIADLIFDKTQPIFRKDHRGLSVMTGNCTGDNFRVSIITHGMGTGSSEIVLNEILALKAIDIDKRQPKKVTEPLNIIRVGTSGALSIDTKLGTTILTKYAVGLDSTGLFYDIKPQNPKVTELENTIDRLLDEAIPDNRRFKGKIHPYASMPDTRMVEALEKSAEKHKLPCKVGITASAPGFFNCQGRLLFDELPGTVTSIENALSFDFDGVRPENFEMEISIFSLIASGLKWVRFGAMCMVIANRKLNTFAKDTESSLDPTILTVVDALREMDKVPL
ncbi:purine nucleoside phosphorylase, putative [Entamoeba invadens IP1]|uniref:purine nucleoside phosphorylase, putative n=1 Tax=Entamoeba invadens IP1 TaxID=370355 RepID=UPI0002C3E042|nr:purine nucleoside phosphorylase, putative [Entamoeba invadens IP1]ELP93453.1 purine nucleoside phosphorylase, putative [Entamoeba invadens IP1]|eukprot:XP_004260224.1 purine nucleoside phosphorylase, putative [Entamoeba invadens IP1]